MSYMGTYDRTIFYNPVNKYCVISVKTNDQSIQQQARSAYRHRDRLIRFVATGYELPQTDKVSMVLEGEWTTGKHGYQLQVERCEEIVPQTRDGVQGYLSSRLIKGVGEKTAALIVGRFGADALKVLENEPERLLEIRGITPAKLEDIKASYAESRCIRDLMVLLSPYNVTPVTALKIYEHFGARSVDILRDDPFELCRIPGFGFKRVDAIVRKGDTPMNSPMRIHGAVYAALEVQREDKGHLFLDRKPLLQTAYQLLNERLLPQMRVKPDEITSVLDGMILKGEVVSSDGRIYQTPLFIQEDETARKIAQMLSVKTRTADITAALETVRRGLGITLSQRQTEAVYMAFHSNLSIITGGPGTGKTTILRAVIEVFKALYPEQKILLAAPTGRASRRMAESTGRNDAKTLHSLLGLLGDNTVIRRDRDKTPLDAGLIIVDETSMMDMWLARQFFERVLPDTMVVLVGDVDQLQSVGAGDVFRELITCGQVPVTVLDEVFRQKENSRIALNAKKFNEDNAYLDYGDDFIRKKCKTQEEAAELICQTFCEEAAQNGVEHVQILSPFRSEGLASVEKLNECIREMVNPGVDGMPDLKVGGKYFRTGDKIMQTKNNEQASNGDIGFIRSIGRDEKGVMKVKIEFSAARVAEYGMEDMSNIEIAYATTVHKAMGSEYDIVIMPLLTSHSIMLQKNLIYTAITRARHKVILVGQTSLLFRVVEREKKAREKNESLHKRNTLLGERICKYLRAFSRQAKMKNAS